jgi:AraC-like DNA-binding protein
MIRKGRSKMGYNIRSDEFIFTNKNPRHQDDLVYIEQAGITRPDPDYYMKRTKILPCYKYLYVFEYVLSGKGYIECDGKTYEVSAGDFYFLNRRIEVYYHADKNDPFEKIWINISGSFINLMVEAYHLNMPVLVCRMDAEKYIRKLHDIMIGARGKSIESAYPDIMHCFIDLFRDIDNYLNMTAKNDDLYERICKYIDSNLCFPISVDDIAKNFYISRSTLFRLFIEKYGNSPKKYILDQKIQLAKSILPDYSIKIEDIASLLHFSDKKHFSTTFKKLTGVPPANYRFGLTESYKNKSGLEPGVFIWQYSTIVSRSTETFNWQADGMGYVIRTGTGKFIVIDGGTEKDAGELIDLISRESFTERPDIAVWILTHPHGDHYGALAEIADEQFLKRHIKLDAVAFNIPNTYTGANGNCLDGNIKKIREIPSRMRCGYIRPRSGEKIIIDDVELQFFFTPEDQIFDDANELSLIFKISTEKKSVMITGDSYSRPLHMVAERYDRNLLKCDFCQAAHHGLNGGSSTFYHIVAPDVVFVPASKPAYDAMMTGKYSTSPSTYANRELMQNAKEICLAANGNMCYKLN